MSNNYLDISLETLVVDLDVSPKMKFVLKEEKIITVRDLLLYANKLKNRTGDIPRKIKKIGSLASEIEASKPDLVFEAKDCVTKINITLGTTIDSLDWPEIIKKSLINVGIKTLGQLIANSTEVRLKEKGILGKYLIKDILRELEKLCILAPQLKEKMDNVILEVEKERNSIMQLPIKELKWISADIVTALNEIGIETLGELGNVTKESFINTDVKLEIIEEIIRLVNKIKKWFKNDEIKLESSVNCEINTSIIPLDIRNFAPWWIKKLNYIGIYSVNGIIECGGVYGLIKKGIKNSGATYDYASSIWNVVEALSQTSTEIKTALNKKKTELLNKRNRYLRIPLLNIIDVPTDVLTIIEILQLKYVGDLLSLTPEDLASITDLTYVQRKKIFDYILKVEMFCNNGDLEIILPKDYVIKDDVNNKDFCEETEFAKLVKKRRALQEECDDWENKKKYIEKRWRIIYLAKNKGE